ncbi:MAG TPA: hydroxymethylbilane synthase [Verrucomicrobiae bacterium]|jgi:hydroxymethylbilane synthase|nr:hydroxymethylbilane synthase [Verrucomicrobiae bacterium]
MSSRPIKIATRGSALALAQANTVLAKCRKVCPDLAFELNIIKTTGDKLQTASMSRVDATLPRGLFTKELEIALLDGSADFAVHSLKDLPTELPDGLILAGVAGERADVRDVWIYRAEGGPARGFPPRLDLKNFPAGISFATSSTRRKAQILAARPDFKAMEIRGNVPTRLQKLASQAEMDATILAVAGLGRLGVTLNREGALEGELAPAGLRAVMLDLDTMLPCVGQGAIGLEARAGDERVGKVCHALNHEETLQSVLAERSFLRAMGGGCQSPVGAHASVENGQLRLRAISFLTEPPRRADAAGAVSDAAALGEKIAAQLRA